MKRALAAAFLLASPAAAQDAPATFAIVNARVETISGPALERATVVVSGGKIAAVGAGVPVPEGATTIDAAGQTLYPGLIDGLTVLGLTEIGSVAGSVDTAEQGDFNPHAKAWVALQPHSDLIPVARANGVTAALAAPSGGLVSGQSALIRLTGTTPEAMVIKAPAALNLEYPSGRPAFEFAQLFQEPELKTFEERQQDKKKNQEKALRKLGGWIDDARAFAAGRAAASDAAGKPDLALESLAPFARGEAPVIIRADTEADIRGAVAFAGQRGLKAVIAGGADAWRCATLLKEKDVPVLLNVDRVPRREDEPYDAAYANAAILHKHGVRFAIVTDDASQSRNLPYEASMARAFGLPAAAALRAITLAPAEIFGVADRLGSIEAGKQATLVLAGGDIMDARTQVTRVWIDGVPQSLETRHTRLYEEFKARPERGVMTTLLRAAGALLFAATTLAMAADERAAIREAQAKALEAHQKRDYAGFLLHSSRVAALAPRSTRALYNLACAQALAGNAKEALALLDRLARMGLALDPAADADFASLKHTPEFQALARRFTAASEPIAKAELAFTLSQPDLITEGIAHDPASGDFFVSSVHRRKILRVDKAGVARDFTAEGQDGLMAVLALAVDAPRGALWASSEGVTYMSGFRKEDEGRSFVFEYDLKTGRLRRRLGLPAGVTGGRLSDLTVSAAGDLYVADPVAGRVYRLGAGEKELSVLVEPGPLGSPQGLALSADGRWLFAADYTQGIARVDTKSGAATLIEAPEDAALTGIDGLVAVDGGLVGIQNGIRPHRILKLQLDPAATRVVSVTVLERAHPRWDEPTLGVLVGRDLYYVATSQYGAIQQDGSLAKDKLQPPVVLRLPLEP